MSTLIDAFDVWRAGYGNATVAIYLGGTTEYASVFYDFALTQPAPNPQRLETFVSGGVNYGKFERALYTEDPYEVRIVDTGENTGVMDSPRDSLDGKDAGKATVRATGASQAAELSALLGVTVYALHFGSFTSDAAANTTILSAALAAASARGGAKVFLPAGTIPHNALSVPANVTLAGQGRAATILQCQSGEAAVTLAGNGAAMESLTLDGVQRIVGSIGLKGVARMNTRLNNVLIKRFDINVEFRGASFARWTDVNVEDGGDNVRLWGDDNSGNPDAGSQVVQFSWIGGACRQSSRVGIDLSYEDFPVRYITVDGVQISDNTETAIRVHGAQFVEFSNCDLSGNTKNLLVEDDDLDTVPARRENTVRTLTFTNCAIDGGTMSFAGECETVMFDRCRLSEITVTLTSPKNSVLVRDSIELETSLLGVTQAWARWTSHGDNVVVGRTTDGTAVTAWRRRLDYGEAGIFTAEVVAVSRNVAQFLHHVRRGMYQRAGLTLPFAGQTADFTLGTKIIGQVSGASGIIQAQTDSGTTGTLTLIAVEGNFIDDEQIKEDGGAGLAFVNLPATMPAVAAAASDVAVQAVVGAGGTVSFAASGEHVILTITGIASQITDWTVRVEETLTRA